MKRKFSKPVELHEFFLSELRNIVGEDCEVKDGHELLDFFILPIGESKCLFQTTLLDLLKFFEEYRLNYYIDFEFCKLRVYTSERTQKYFHRL